MLCNLLNTVPKVKYRMIRYSIIIRVLVVHPGSFKAAWELRGLMLPRISKENLLHVDSLAEDQNSEFEVQFLLNVYCSYTILKSKNHKSDCHKSGTLCSVDSSESLSPSQTSVQWGSTPLSPESCKSAGKEEGWMVLQEGKEERGGRKYCGK